MLSNVFHSLLFDELGRQGWKYVLLPAAYGFVAGHLAGLVFRKLVVACGVAAIIGGVGAAAWLPSLLAGGVRNWQLWLPPLLALVTGRLLMRPWAADRIAARGPLKILIGGCAATLLALGAGISYRVLEVPDQPDGEADIHYVAGLLPFDQNHGGRDFKTAAERVCPNRRRDESGFNQPGSWAFGNRRPFAADRGAAGAGGRPERLAG